MDVKTITDPGTAAPKDRIEGEPSDWVLIIDNVPTSRFQYRNDAEAFAPEADLPTITNPGYGATTGLPRRS